jgi:hypothetical protein
MAFSLIASGQASNTSATVTVAGLNMTGVNLIVVVRVYYTGASGITFGDTESNSYSTLTPAEVGANGRVEIAYKYAPVVSSSMDFTFAGTSLFPALAVYGFSGAAASPFDQENGNAASGLSSIQPGLVTPSEDNELIFAGVNMQNSFSGPTVNSSFVSPPPSEIAYNGATNYGLLASYLIQTSAGAVNPTFSWTGSIPAAAAIATFKGGTPSGPLLRSPIQSNLRWR